MNVAFCVEGDTDEAVFSTLLEKILAQPITPDPFRFRRNGWDSAVKQVEKVAWHAYRNGLHGALFAIDNDGELIHDSSHLANEHPRCRWCILRERIPAQIAQQPRDGLPPLFFIVAVPVQIIEVWLLIARGDWAEPAPGSRGQHGADRGNLKRELYGVADPDGQRMQAVARNILASANLDELSARSPSFDHFRRQALAAPHV